MHPWMLHIGGSIESKCFGQINEFVIGICFGFLLDKTIFKRGCNIGVSALSFQQRVHFEIIYKFLFSKP